MKLPLLVNSMTATIDPTLYNLIIIIPKQTPLKNKLIITKEVPAQIEETWRQIERHMIEA